MTKMMRLLWRQHTPTIILVFTTMKIMRILRVVSTIMTMIIQINVIIGNFPRNHCKMSSDLKSKPAALIMDIFSLKIVKLK